MAETLKGPADLKRKLACKRVKTLTRYKYYEMKHTTRDLGVSTPPELRWFTEVLGWCSKAVDCMADRIQFKEFRDDNLGMNEIFQTNNMDILTDSAVLSACINSCSFIYISPDETGYPRLQVIDGGNATGEIDPITWLLKEGYAVLKRDGETDKPTLEAYFTPNETIYYENGKMTQGIKHNAGQVLLVPIIYRPDDKRPFGHSRISRACMALQESAIRTIKRSEITAEFYSFPQKYAIGISPDLKLDKWKSTISSMLTITNDEDGNHPTVGQFNQQSVTPHLEQLKIFASLFAGETGLTMDDLGFPQDNPSSSEAIRAAHETLRLTGRKAQRSFGVGFLNTGYVAACLRDNFPYKRQVAYLTKPIFAPLFELDNAGMAGLGDAILKLNQAVPDYVDAEKIKDLTGI